MVFGLFNSEKNKLRREYTGDWANDKKTGRGTAYYKCGDRYDGIWLDNKPHGEGRIIFANGDVYEGMWFFGKRNYPPQQLFFVSGQQLFERQEVFILAPLY